MEIFNFKYTQNQYNSIMNTHVPQPNFSDCHYFTILFSSIPLQVFYSSILKQNPNIILLNEKYFGMDI